MTGYDRSIGETPSFWRGYGGILFKGKAEMGVRLNYEGSGG